MNAEEQHRLLLLLWLAGHTFSIVPEGIEAKRALPGVGTEEGEASWEGTELNPALEGTSHVPVRRLPLPRIHTSTSLEMS
jgi:hypothetical protein